MVGICGTPGTGKKTAAPLVAHLLGLRAISLNSLAPKGETEVDTGELREALLKLAPPRAVLYGHLLPHVVRKQEVELVAVLRCEPAVLRSRLAKRRYDASHVVENVEAELIGVVLDECVRRFGQPKVAEYDTTSDSPEQVARAIASDIESVGKKVRRRREWIDWSLNYDSSTKLRSLLSGGNDPPAST